MPGADLSHDASYPCDTRLALRADLSRLHERRCGSTSHRARWVAEPERRGRDVYASLDCRLVVRSNVRLGLRLRGGRRGQRLRGVRARVPLAAISKRALPAYQAAIANSPATAPGEQCLTNCPDYGSPCCNSGRCTDQCPSSVLGLNDCAEAGGACIAIDSLPDAAPTCSRLGDCPISASQFGVCCPVVDASVAE